MTRRLAISFQGEQSLARYRDLGAIVARYPFAAVSVYQDLFYQPPWPALFELARATNGSGSEPLVGPAVLNPYLCHPVLAAAHLAMLDAESGGRAYLGVGRGAFFEPIGVAQPRPLTAIAEYVACVQRFLRGDREPFEGELFRAGRDAYLRFPVPGRELPVLVGGWGPKTLALAGRIADKVKVGGSANPDAVAEFRERIAAGARAAGRDPEAIDLVLGAVTALDRDRGRAEALARRRVAMYVEVVGRMDPAYEVPSGELSAVSEALARGDAEAAGRALSVETLARFCLYGTPRDVVAHLERLFDAGVDAFELGSPHGPDEDEALRLLGEEVLPYFER